MPPGPRPTKKGAPPLWKKVTSNCAPLPPSQAATLPPSPPRREMVTLHPPGGALHPMPPADRATLSELPSGSRPATRAVGESEADTVGVRELLGVGEREGETLGEVDLEGVPEAVAVGERLTPPPPLREGVAVRERVMEGVTVRVLVALPGEGEREGEGERDGERERVDVIEGGGLPYRATWSMAMVNAVVVAPQQYLIHRLARLSRAPVVAGRETEGKLLKIPAVSVPPPREVYEVPLLIEYQMV